VYVVALAAGDREDAREAAQQGDAPDAAARRR
jgi:hypothetical protein